ncbi:MAG: glycosyl transferase [Planctomycetaceae bacterium]|nr:glycosyl transferase [Planctomycetaceae bacterium]
MSPPVIKVTLCIPTLDRSGAEKQLALLATRLPRDEFDVDVVALTRGGPYETMLAEAGVPLTVLNKRLRFDPGALWKLKRHVRARRPDILHTWLFAANAYGRLVGGKKAGPKVVVSERCVDSWKSGWQHWIDRQRIARTACLVGNSQSVVDFYVDRGFPQERTRVIFNGIEGPEPAPIDRPAALQALGIPANAHIVGFVGRLAKQKQVKDLIWGIELLHQIDDRVHLVLVGDGPERRELEAFARQAYLEQRVHFLGHRDDVGQLWPLFDVFWLASDFEGQSNSLMEAMAAGVPAVVSDIAPNRELVVDGETGFLAKPGDSAAFSQFADRILADEELARRLGGASRERMREHFSVERMVEAHARLYQDVVEAEG